MKRNGNAERRRRENRGAEVGSGRGIPLPSRGRVWEGGCAPSPEFFFWFFCLAMVHFGAFYVLFFSVSIRRVKQSRKAVLCANCQLVNGGRIIHDIIHINTSYIRVSSQPVRHTCSLYYGHSRHTRTIHAAVYLYILLSCILLQEIQLNFTKVTFCWWHVYFYDHISGVWSCGRPSCLNCQLSSAR